MMCKVCNLEKKKDKTREKIYVKSSMKFVRLFFFFFVEFGFCFVTNKDANNDISNRD